MINKSYICVRNILVITLLSISVFAVFVKYREIIFEEKDNKKIPINLIIPSLSIDSKIETVQLTTLGAVGVPNNPEDVGWFEESPIPGEIGNSIIDGHSGWKGDTQAVFDNLKKINIGEKIYIKNYDGSVTAFVVKEIHVFTPNEDYKRVFIPSDNNSHLNIITCTGYWDDIRKTHEDRLVVFTDRQ